MGRLLLWACIFALRSAIGLMLAIVVWTVLGRGPAARRTMLGLRTVRRITRL